MSAAVRSCVLAALLVAGCAKGDSLVVVTVDASPAIANVALLHTTSMAGDQSIMKDVGADKAPFSLGDGVTKTFGVQVPSSISGAFSIHVEARNASGLLAQGDAGTTLSPGNRRDIQIVLAVAVVAEPVWIGSGGSVASAAQQLNISIGGTDIVGALSVPGGSGFTSGFFSSQTN